MSGETDLSYLSAFYCTSAVLLLLTSVFAAVSRSWGVSGRVLHFWKRSL
jgi:hypothetical protein